MAGTLRTPETDQRYKEHIQNGGLEECPLCRIEPTKTFTYWKIIPNEFPYDRVTDTHDMIVPLRHTAETELTHEERAELTTIQRGYVADTYQYMLEAMKNFRSVPAHYHIHLITLKDS